MAIANNDVLVVQKTTTGQICKTTVADLIAGAPDNVTSVNGQTGTVVLDLGNLDDVDVSAVADGETLIYSSGSWGVGMPDSGSEVIVSATEPSTAGVEEGTLWWNSTASDLSLYVLYIDPVNGAEWVKTSSGSDADGVKVKIDDGGVKQVIQSAGLGISDGTTENITLNADGTATFGGEVGVAGRVYTTGTSAKFVVASALTGTSTDVAVDINDIGGRKAGIFLDGSAEFAGGKFAIEGTGQFTFEPGSGNGKISTTYGSNTAIYGKQNDNTTDAWRLSGDGSAMFASGVDGKYFRANEPNAAGADSAAFLGQLAGTETSRIKADGSAEFAGLGTFKSDLRVQDGGNFRVRVAADSGTDAHLLQSNSTATLCQGNVTLDADGSATFAGRIRGDQYVSSDNVNLYMGAKPGNKSDNFGFVVTDATTGNLVGGIKTDGGAEFSGDIQIGSNLTLRASDGTIYSTTSGFNLNGSTGGASFSGAVTIDSNGYLQTTRTDGGVAYIGASSSELIQLFSGATKNVNINKNGSANFNGTVTAAGFNIDALPSLP